MPMRDQPEGVHRAPRGAERPPKGYDIMVDGEYAGWVERLPKQAWRAYPEGGSWKRFSRQEGGYLAAAEMIAGQHRARQARNEPAAVAESAQVRQVPASVADPFAGDRFADPLA